MTVIGAYGDGKEVDGRLLRLAMMTVLNSNVGSLSCDGGVRMNSFALDALQVVPGSSGLTVKVKPGMCVVPGTETTGQGPYFVANDADLTITLATADGAQSRYDRIVAVVVDHGDATTSYTITKVTGTPAGSPSLPAIPANSLKLGAVLVPPNASTPGVLTITDERRQLGTLGRTFQNFGFMPGALYRLPQYETTSSTFLDVIEAVQTVQLPTLYLDLLVQSDSDTTGEIRATVNDVQFGATQTIAAGTYTSKIFGPATIPGFGSTINLGSTAQVEVSLRKTGGAGKVRCDVRTAQWRALG